MACTLEIAERRRPGQSCGNQAQAAAKAKLVAIKARPASGQSLESIAPGQEACRPRRANFRIRLLSLPGNGARAETCPAARAALLGRCGVPRASRRASGTRRR